MTFYFPLGARTYFKPIDDRKDATPKFDSMFDKFYLCMMVGLDARRLAPDSDLETEEFIRGYPHDYHTQSDIIAGLLIDAELDRKDIRPEDKESIEREMLRLFDPASPTKLSEAGNHLLSQYAAEGFKLIRDEIFAPTSLEDFLLAYHKIWRAEKLVAT